MKLNKLLTVTALTGLIAVGVSTAPAAFAGTTPHSDGGAVYINAAPSSYYPRTLAPAQVALGHDLVYAGRPTLAMQPVPAHRTAQYYVSVRASPSLDETSGSVQTSSTCRSAP